MTTRKFWLLGGLLVTLVARQAPADDVRYYNDNGVTYRETTQTVKRAIPHTEMQQREVTFNRERYTSDLQDVTRTYQVPVTEYQYEPRWEGRWNPFVQPSVTYRLVPKTRWETRSETVKIPVSRREIVPEKLMQTVAVPTHKIAEERVVTRVAVGTTPTTAPVVGTVAASGSLAPSGQAAASAPNPYGLPPASLPAGSTDSVGGVAKLDPNQPKQNPDWRSSDARMR